jgi:hypothetical protein
LLFNPSHVLVLGCSNKFIPGWLEGFCNAIFFFGLIGNTAWQKRDGELDLELGFDDVLSFGLLVLCMQA